MTRQEKLLALADQIDHEKLWRRAGIDRQNMTPDQRARLDAGVMLRRYANIMTPGHWLLIPPTGPVQFGASTLDEVYEMAKRDQARASATAPAQEAAPMSDEEIFEMWLELPEGPTNRTRAISYARAIERRSLAGSAKGEQA
jgi:hypothetical protein